MDEFNAMEPDTNHHLGQAYADEIGIAQGDPLYVLHHMPALAENYVKIYRSLELAQQEAKRIDLLDRQAAFDKHDIYDFCRVWIEKHRVLG